MRRDGSGVEGISQHSLVESVSDKEEALNAQSQVLGSLNGPGRGAMRDEEPEIRACLAVVGGEIESRRDELSQAWRDRVSKDVLLASSPAWSRRQFDDHIPEVIVVLCAKLRSWPDVASLHQAEQKTAEAHSQHRWQQGYDMRSLAREWGHLNSCLLEILDRFWIAPDTSAMQQALRVARSLVAEIILESTSESVSEYSSMVQAEASSRARRMEEVIEGLREEERARGQALRQAAHDMRGSLGIVTGSASLVDREQMEQGDRAEAGRLLRRGVRSLQEIMTDLIDLARLEAGEEKVQNRLFDAGEMLRELGATSSPLAQQKNLELRLEGPDELSAWGDAIKVRRIAQNLLLNAIKYTLHGSVTMSWALDGHDRWILRVSDTGPGLHRSPARSLAQALEEATSTAREIEGRTEGEQNPISDKSAPDKTTPDKPVATDATAGHVQQAPPPTPEPMSPSQAFSAEVQVSGEGIGLSIVKRLCDLLGASIELKSEPGAGSTFLVLFPRTPAVGLATQKSAAI